jgi:hypothetical protein
MKIPPPPQWDPNSSTQTDEQMDRQTEADITKLIVGVGSFANAPIIFALSPSFYA